MKHDPNMSLVCVHAETDDAHGDCLKEDCGCECHQPTDDCLKDGCGCSCHGEEEYEEAQ